MKVFFTTLIALISPFGLLLAQCPTSIVATGTPTGSSYNLTISNLSQCPNYAVIGTKILNLNGTPYGVSACSDDSGSPVVELTIVAGNTPVPLTGTITITGITGSPSCVYNSGVLPVELLSFSGKNTEGGNLLTWQTASEVNNKGFEVERLNGNDWQTLGFVKGNNKAATYQFTDNNPLATSYYRLRQIDNDGKETLSKALSIQSKGKGNRLNVYPNPVANVLTLENTEGSDFQIINLLGQQVLTGKTTQRLDVSGLPQGSYVLKVGAEQAKFIKQ